MILFATAAGISTVFIGTLLLFRAFGVAPRSVLFDRRQKLLFDKVVSRGWGNWIFRFNVFGTLTSLSTVYVFFLGTSKLFGVFIFICPLSLFLGYAAVNYFTARVLELRTRYSGSLTAGDQVAAVFANIVWENDRESKASARFLQALSIFGTALMLWLELAVFAALLSTLFQLSYLEGAIFMAGVGAAVVYITLRYGLRGFVFSDILLSPLVVAGSLTTLLAVTGHLLGQPNVGQQLGSSYFLWPALGLRDSLLFVAHVSILNLFFVVLTEPHWFRVWIFGKERSSRLQRGSMGATSILWSVLAIVGLVAGISAPHDPAGVEGVAQLLERAVLHDPIYLVLFWTAASAALFSTAEAQIYSLIIITAYDANTGNIRPVRGSRARADAAASRTRSVPDSRRGWISSLLLLSPSPMRPSRPFITSVAAALVLGATYYIVRELAIPFEKLIFILVPTCLNGLPALACVAGRVPLKAWFLYLSTTLYVACAIGGLLQGDESYFWALMAAIVPVGVSLSVLLFHVMHSAAWRK